MRRSATIAVIAFLALIVVTRSVQAGRVVQFEILVDGKEVDSLAGHIDLREPITRANAWIRKGQ